MQLEFAWGSFASDGLEKVATSSHKHNIYRLHFRYFHSLSQTNTHIQTIMPLTSSWWVWDGNGRFPWWQSPRDIRARYDLHLLRGDVIVQNGLPSVFHGVQLVCVGVTARRRLPWEHVCCWDVQRTTRTRGEKTAVLVLTSMVRICHSSGELSRKCYYLMHESRLKNRNMMFTNEMGIVLLRENH